MENLRNKSQEINKKDYFKRFIKLNVFSYTKPNDNKIYIGAKPTEVFSLFKGNTNSTKKAINESNYVHPDDVFIDQSALQYYIILGLQDFYFNYYNSMLEENRTLKEEISKIQSMLKIFKKKNDERFDVLTKNLETLARHINNIKK
jgi:hypothetical protein